MTEDISCPICSGRLERNFEYKLSRSQIMNSFKCIDCKRGWQICEKYIKDGKLKQTEIITTLEEKK